jgi:arylsulfatase A-like enzyme
MDGKSLVPLLGDPAEDIRDHMAFINVWGDEPTRCLSALTKQWKYTYWWYSGQGMEPVEELFDTENDPLELVNLAGDPQYATELEQMRSKYDNELASWKAQAVPYNDYQRYGTDFERQTGS